jgi:hypothetical protein
MWAVLCLTTFLKETFTVDIYNGRSVILHLILLLPLGTSSTYAF